MDAPNALPLELAPTTELPQNDPLAPDIETASDRYALRFTGAQGRFLLEQQTRTVASLLDMLPPGQLRILDVGGGHGQLTQLFVSRGHQVAVHGSSSVCFSRVSVLQARYPDQVSCLMGTLTRLPAADREFDLVCSIRLLGHMEHWKTLLAEKCRVAARYVICEFASPQGLQRFAQSFFRVKLRMEPDTRPFRAFEPGEVESELQRHGFRTVAVERQLVLPIAFHRHLSSPSLSRGTEICLERLGFTRTVGSPVVLLAERSSTWNEPSRASHRH